MFKCENYDEFSEKYQYYRRQFLIRGTILLTISATIYAILKGVK